MSPIAWASQSVRMPARHTRGTAWASGQGAGRKRRSSGPRSAISQHTGEIYAVDHWLYFRRRAETLETPVNIDAARPLVEFSR